MQEFRRLATKYSLDVHNIPIGEMDELYSMDDIELWEVRRVGVEFPSDKNDNSANPLKMLSWGEVPLVEVNILNEVISISQAIDGAIGCTLWPSSVVLSRYF